MLIAARAVLGIGGATLMPSTHGADPQHVPRRRAAQPRRSRIWSGAMTGGIALGPVMSGVLLEHFWWGSVFLINAARDGAAAGPGAVLLPEFKDPAPGRFDLLSVPLSMAAVLPVICGIKEIAAEGCQRRHVRLRSRPVWLSAALFVQRQRTAATDDRPGAVPRTAASARRSRSTPSPRSR